METSLSGMKVSKKKSLREEVYDSLRRSILHGKVKGGQRLIEEQLADQVGISRTPVREAFHKLERDDLVSRLPKGGFVVRRFTKEDVEEVFGIRTALESYAAHQATLHLTPDKTSALEKNVDQTAQAVKKADYDKVMQLNTEFHELIYKSCKSRKLLELVNSFRDYFIRYRGFLLKTEDGQQNALQDHQQILDAMQKKNARLVETLVRKHLARGKEIVLKEIEQGRMTP